MSKLKSNSCDLQYTIVSNLTGALHLSGLAFLLKKSFELLLRSSCGNYFVILSGEFLRWLFSPENLGKPGQSIWDACLQFLYDPFSAITILIMMWIVPKLYSKTFFCIYRKSCKLNSKKDRI